VRVLTEAAPYVTTLRAFLRGLGLEFVLFVVSFAVKLFPSFEDRSEAFLFFGVLAVKVWS
jgi:hypothetical protein